MNSKYPDTNIGWHYYPKQFDNKETLNLHHTFYRSEDQDLEDISPILTDEVLISNVTKKYLKQDK